MKKIITLALVSILATGCASTPSAPMTVGAYCTDQAKLVAGRMAVRSLGASPLSGHTDPQSVREYVYKDCLSQASARTAGL